MNHTHLNPSRHPPSAQRLRHRLRWPIRMLLLASVATWDMALALKPIQMTPQGEVAKVREFVVKFDKADGNLPFVPAKHTFVRERCTVCGAPESLEREGRENYAYSFIHDAYPTEELKDVKFDVIVGNPPYQVGTEGHGATASTMPRRGG